MKKGTQLTSKEYEIMKILWASSTPLTSTIIAQQAKMKETSCLTSINSLIAKKYIKVIGSIKVVKTSSRLLSPNITVDEYASIQLSEIYEDTNKDVNVFPLLSFLVKDKKKDKDKEFIDKLKSLIDEYEASDEE